MRFRRLLAPLAIAATSVALAAAPAAATISTTPNPDIRGYVNSVTCVGDTLSGVVRVATLATTANPTARYSGVIELRYNKGGTAFSNVAWSRSFTTTKGTRDNPFSFDVRGLPAGTTQALVYTTVREYGTAPDAAKIDTAQSKPILLSTCAPAEVVPEAPSAVVIPLTLAATAGLTTLAIRRRQTTATAAA